MLIAGLIFFSVLLSAFLGFILGGVLGLAQGVYQILKSDSKASAWRDSFRLAALPGVLAGAWWCSVHFGSSIGLDDFHLLWALGYGATVLCAALPALIVGTGLRTALLAITDGTTKRRFVIFVGLCLILGPVLPIMALASLLDPIIWLSAPVALVLPAVSFMVWCLRTVPDQPRHIFHEPVTCPLFPALGPLTDAAGGGQYPSRGRITLSSDNLYFSDGVLEATLRLDKPFSLDISAWPKEDGMVEVNVSMRQTQSDLSSPALEFRTLWPQQRLREALPQKEEAIVFMNPTDFKAIWPGLREMVCRHTTLGADPFDLGVDDDLLKTLCSDSELFECLACQSYEGTAIEAEVIRCEACGYEGKPWRNSKRWITGKQAVSEPVGKSLKHEFQG